MKIPSLTITHHRLPAVPFFLPPAPPHIPFRKPESTQGVTEAILICGMEIKSEGMADHFNSISISHHICLQLLRSMHQLTTLPTDSY